MKLLLELVATSTGHHGSFHAGLWLYKHIFSWPHILISWSHSAAKAVCSGCLSLHVPTCDTAALQRTAQGAGPCRHGAHPAFAATIGTRLRGSMSWLHSSKMTSSKFCSDSTGSLAELQVTPTMGMLWSFFLRRLSAPCICARIMASKGVLSQHWQSGQVNDNNRDALLGLPLCIMQICLLTVSAKTRQRPIQPYIDSVQPGPALAMHHVYT